MITEVLRAGCAAIAARASYVQIEPNLTPRYATSLPLVRPRRPGARASGEELARRAAFWLTLDAVNFGSGWFPTLRKPPGLSGYRTISGALRRRFDEVGPWTATELSAIDASELAWVLRQAPDHPLMGWFAASLRDLGGHLEAEFGGSFAALAQGTGGSAVGLAGLLGGWRCFADTSTLHGIELPFLKRAQIAAADLHRAGVLAAPDLDRLTMFADNLVPHVLRVDGILRYDDGLLATIAAGELLEPGSPPEIEIRACALHAVELIVAGRADTCAAEIDEILWNRGQEPPYKALPRHRCRGTAY